MESYNEFWTYYLSQHQHRVCRWLHFAGTVTALVVIAIGLYLERFAYIIFAIGLGYFFSWLGHFVFERNKPATFRFPLWSFRAELELCFRMLRGEFR